MQGASVLSDTAFNFKQNKSEFCSPWFYRCHCFFFSLAFLSPSKLIQTPSSTTFVLDGDLRNYFCLHVHKYKTANKVPALKRTPVLYPMENFCLIALGITWCNCKWPERDCRAVALQCLFQPGCREHSSKMRLLKHTMDKTGKKQSLSV